MHTPSIVVRWCQHQPLVFTPSPYFYSFMVGPCFPYIYYPGITAVYSTLGALSIMRCIEPSIINLKFPAAATTVQKPLDKAAVLAGNESIDWQNLAWHAFKTSTLYTQIRILGIFDRMLSSWLLSQTRQLKKRELTHIQLSLDTGR